MSKWDKLEVKITRVVLMVMVSALILSAIDNLFEPPKPPIVGVPKCELGHTVNIRGGVVTNDKVVVICQGADGKWMVMP